MSVVLTTIGDYMAADKAFTENIQPYLLPSDVVEGGPCRLCGKPMHLVKVNPLIAFYIHDPIDIAGCAALNQACLGHPLIVQNNHFFSVLKTALENQEKQKQEAEAQKHE
jgi:hypothetical protein